MFEAQIKILISILEEKAELLKVVLNITENQQALMDFGDYSKEIRDLFTGLTLEKQENINIILENDEIFNSTFEKLEDFENNAKNNRDLVKLLQGKVKAVTDLDMKLRLAEENLKTFVRPQPKSYNKVLAKQLSEKYKNQIKPPGTDQ